MIGPWIARHPSGRVFVSGPAGSLTFGEVMAAVRAVSNVTGQVLVRPDATMESVLNLCALPGEGRQVVITEGGPASREKVAQAVPAVGRRADTILFTSGTSGRPKAVRLTAGNWKAAVSASAEHLGHGPDDVWLAAMPLHHVGGLSVLYRSAHAGGSVRWLPRFETGAAVDALRSGVTLASLVPTMLRRVLDHDVGGYQGLKAVLIGGGPIPEGLLEEAHGRGIPALPTYGMTETCGQVATLRPGSGPRRAAHPLPGIELRIGSGERIEIRGPQVSPGYADEDDRGNGAWFVTPDLGEVDTDGALRVIGRADDVIVTGGENVDPGRIEAVLAAHPGVSEVAVVGVADPEWGQRVVAVYVGRVAPMDLTVWSEGRLARHEIPRSVVPVGSIPTTGSGKPDRPAIVELLT